MKQQQFWELIELSWEDAPEANLKRREALKSNDPDLLEELSFDLTDAVLGYYNQRLSALGKEELTAFIHILEERLYHIDRREIHEYTDGSDDGFLYCRCFIVGMGRAYYEMIDQNPSKAVMDVDAELFGFSAYGIYEERFGEEFDRYSEHSIESCSNAAGWPEE